MTKTIASVALALSLLAGGASGAEPVKAEPFMKIRAPTNARVAPDGAVYVRDWPDGVHQIYKHESGLATADVSKAKRLTSYADGANSFTLSPDGATLLILHAVGGNENTQVDLFDAKTGAPAPLLSNPKVQYSVQQWLPDSSGFIYSANDVSPADFHLYVYDLKKQESRSVLAAEGSWTADDVLDAKLSRVLVSRYFSASKTEQYELDPSRGTKVDLTVRLPDGEASATDIVGYMPDSSGVLVTSDVEKGMKRLFLRGPDGKLTSPIAGLNAHELDNAAMSIERDLLAVTVNQDGYAVIRLFRLPSFEEITLPEIPKGTVFPIGLHRGTLAYSVSNAQQPDVAYSWKVPAKGAAADAPKQITKPDTQGIDLTQFPLPTLVKFTSFDGVEIPAFLYLPVGHQAGKPSPFIVEFHGGPEGQHRPGFNARVQFLLARGYGILQPNVRGSTGYGREFQMMDDYTKRWDSVRDGVAGAQWLVDQGYAKPGQIAAMGGSYGGFMSVATIVEDGTRAEKGATKLFGASVNVVGIVNMETFLEQTSGYRRKLREAEYGPLTDRAFLKSVSPIHQSDKITIPMLIAHGLNDPRVPVGEAMQLAVSLQKRGLNPDLLFFPDEGHGFAKYENRLLYTERVAEFLDASLGGRQ